MGWGARCCWGSSAFVGVLSVLAGCTGGSFFAEREVWRHEAEVQCLNSGAVKEGPGIVRIDPIRGPGICGADFPFKVSSLGESSPFGYADEIRPPEGIAGNSTATPPAWPIKKPAEPTTRQNATTIRNPVRAPLRYESGGSPNEPISLYPPGVNNTPDPPRESYDFRRPYGTSAPPARSRAEAAPSSLRDDFSPVPYERRPLVDTQRPPMRTGVTRAPLRDPPYGQPPPSREMTHEPDIRGDVAPVVPLRSQEDVPVTGSARPVAIKPAATLACPLVSELDRWLANSVQPAAMRWFGAPVAEIKQISAYSCRGMNGNSLARISEHAFGNALDIASFTLSDGRTITVKGGWHGLPEEQGFLRDVQGAACDQFTTVLGPGSNAYHYDHIHVDLMRRGDGHRACNPHAVSGEEIAARAGGRYTARRGSEPSVTGSFSARRLASSSRRPSREGDEEERRGHALPWAEPGADGEED
jgi:Extensin-like protein C-terminus